MEPLHNSLVSTLMIWIVVINDSVSNVVCPIEVHLTVVSFRLDVTLATDTVEINGRDPEEEFLAISNVVPLIIIIASGDISETSFVLDCFCPDSG